MVVFGADRGQVFGVAARTITSTAAALLLLLLLLHFCVVGSSRRKPQKTREQVVRTRKLMQPCRLGKILVVINWLDLYAVESAARYG